MSRIAATFDRLRRNGGHGLVTYVTAGDPDLNRSRDVLLALDRGGADVIEVGVPFSDPVADGPSIQRASDRALAAGGSLSATLDLVASVRSTVAAPIVLFTYVNPVLRMGADRFLDRAKSVGIDGVLMLDLPIEESEATERKLRQRALDQIFLVSPTTSDARLRHAADLGSGFLYAISRLGVTGTRDAVSRSAAPLVQRIRAASRLPVALGFGISRPEHVKEVWEFADAAVVGSALVDVIDRAAQRGEPPDREVEAFVRWLKS